MILYMYTLFSNHLTMDVHVPAKVAMQSRQTEIRTNSVLLSSLFHCDFTSTYPLSLCVTNLNVTGVSVCSTKSTQFVPCFFFIEITHKIDSTYLVWPNHPQWRKPTQSTCTAIPLNCPQNWLALNQIWCKYSTIDLTFDSISNSKSYG